MVYGRGDTAQKRYSTMIDTVAGRQVYNIQHIDPLRGKRSGGGGLITDTSILCRFDIFRCRTSFSDIDAAATVVGPKANNGQTHRRHGVVVVPVENTGVCGAR